MHLWYLAAILAAILDFKELSYVKTYTHWFRVLDNMYKPNIQKMILGQFCKVSRLGH